MKTYCVRVADMYAARRLNAIICSYDFDAVLRQGDVAMDARSFLGILSVNLGEPVFLDIYGQDAELDAQLADFIVKP